MKNKYEQFNYVCFKNLSINPKIPDLSINKSCDNRINLKGSDQDLKLGCAPDSSSFVLWKDAMKMVARLPDGIPPDFRKQLWLTLAKKHLDSKNIDLKRAFSVCLSEKSDPEDAELGTQIIKDLHRTGCSPFSGDVAEQNQSHLKRVLLAYARWNPGVGYCQGFNMLAAIVLEVVDWIEEDALIVMIFLIEEVLPESYFANHLRGLSVDMAVFRDLLRLRLSSLSAHLDKLQSNTQDTSTGHIYEPPLTNVFTMQWFLTLFTNCLPKDTVLRVWDLIFLEGNEVLLRAALAIWDGLADRIMAVESADEFYCIMGVLTREILEFGLMDANMFIKTVCTLAPFPFPQLQELRDSYTYNIQPFTSSWSTDAESMIFSGELDDEDEDLNTAKWYFSNELQWYRKKAVTMGNIGPGAYSSSENNFPLSFTNFNTERMTLDISSLKKQYMKLRERQKQAHVILSVDNTPVMRLVTVQFHSRSQIRFAKANVKAMYSKNNNNNNFPKPLLTESFPALEYMCLQNHFQNRRRNSLAVNHLLMGKQPLIRKKSHQPHYVFAEKNTVSKTTQNGSNKQAKNNDSDDEKEYLETSHAIPFQVETVSENAFCLNDVSNPLTKCCDNKVVACKPKNLSAISPSSSSEIVENNCNCSLSFTCPSHVDASIDKPAAINPFPTKRRVGSMKTKK
ncbi:TBC1 domain family member 30 [Caerostris extrusa]|uniref:TBC1 domain family member 30 n=1 Tax=Caerostris extrusa TaxID=172846 RepID=A0AAV4XVF7_CAEEX|nr:TBC1 domain family member 30 [Caerostris extrusa]